ncbi:MAG: carboxypeptidase-like regulatory domain-containing protein [Acidobacteria bacterium]|nr:carboxypeptidase-like regulatory domain-containing protein [Acidobacteriota bacterium]
MKNLLRSLTLFLTFLSMAAFAAAQITGTVTNRTTDKPSAGDTVVLLRLAQGMQEVATATTDAKGMYTLNAPADGAYLVRVTHDKATYFGPVMPGTKTVNVDVYNVSAHVSGVSTEAIVIRAQTDASGSTLNVVENFFVKNDSKPAMTQFSNNPFGFYLPVGAVVEASAAMAPGGMPVAASPVPLGEKGHYTFLFPIRPGETRFQVAYHVAYPGTLSLDMKVDSPTDTFAVIVPKSMNFTPVAGAPFNPINDDVNAQTFVARGVDAKTPIGFQLTGTGALPRESQSGAQASSQGQDAAGNGQDASTNDTAPGKGLGNPLDPNNTREPLSTKYKWWILGGLGLILVAAAGVLLRKPANATMQTNPVDPTRPPALPQANILSPATQNERLLQVLKDEVFALETERLQGTISDADYVQQKAAVELVLRRALHRSAHVPAASNPTA